MEYVFYKHEGCDKLHFTIGEIRRCAGHWIRLEDLKTIVLVERIKGNEDK